MLRADVSSVLPDAGRRSAAGDHVTQRVIGGRAGQGAAGGGEAADEIGVLSVMASTPCEVLPPATPMPARVPSQAQVQVLVPLQGRARLRLLAQRLNDMQYWLDLSNAQQGPARLRTRLVVCAAAASPRAAPTLATGRTAT
jgi:hypothetical protein